MAEDSLSFAVLYKQLFESRGHQVVLTGDGDECLSLYMSKLNSSGNREPFDMVLLDYSMPKRNGFDTAKEILAVRPDQRILFITSFGDKVTPMLKGLSKGTNIDIIEKPFNSASLIQKIEYEIQEQDGAKVLLQ